MSRLILVALALALVISAQVAVARETQEAGMEATGEAMPGGEYTAVISAGRARIRAAADMDGEIVGYCQKGSALTVWLPAIDGWLTASCEGATGYIHQSLVTIGSMVPEDSDDAMMDDSMMMDDSKMDDSMEKDETMTAMPGGEYAAVISAGRARIRAAAGMDGEIIGHCAAGSALTVWLPAIDGWLTASCHGVTGFIHASLVAVGNAVIPTVSEVAMATEDGEMMTGSM